MLVNTKTKKGKSHFISLFLFLVIFVAGFYTAYQFGLLKGVKMVPPIPLFADCSTIQTEIEKYDWDTEIALAVVKAESQCNISAYGDEDLIFQKHGRNYGYSVGAFQVRILPGREGCDSYDVVTNVKCAYDIYKKEHNSFEPWSGYTTGEYKKYLWRSLEEL